MSIPNQQTECFQNGGETNPFAEVFYLSGLLTKPLAYCEGNSQTHRGEGLGNTYTIFCMKTSV